MHGLAPCQPQRQFNDHSNCLEQYSSRLPLATYEMIFSKDMHESGKLRRNTAAACTAIMTGSKAAAVHGACATGETRTYRPVWCVPTKQRTQQQNQHGNICWHLTNALPLCDRIAPAQCTATTARNELTDYQLWSHRNQLSFETRL